MMHETIQIGDVRVTILRRGDETGGQFCLCEVRLPPGGTAVMPDTMMHLDCDELVIGIDGETVWKVGSEERTLLPGERLWIPRRVAHHFRNCATTPACFASIYQPGVMDPAFFRALAEAMEFEGPGRTLAVGHALARFRTVPVSSH